MKFLRKDMKELMHTVGSTTKTTMVRTESSESIPSNCSFNHTDHMINLNISNCSPTKPHSPSVNLPTTNTLVEHPMQPRLTPTTAQHHFQQQQPIFLYHPYFNRIPTRAYLDHHSVETIFNTSPSINNFAQRLMRQIFSLEERKGKSVFGTKRATKDGLLIKEGLDKDKIS